MVALAQFPEWWKSLNVSPAASPTETGDISGENGEVVSTKGESGEDSNERER